MSNTANRLGSLSRTSLATLGLGLILTGCAGTNQIVQLQPLPPLPPRTLSYTADGDASGAAMKDEIANAIARAMVANTAYRVYREPHERDWRKTAKVTADAVADVIKLDYRADWKATATPVEHHSLVSFLFPVKGGYGEGNCYHFTLSWPSSFADKSGRIPNFDSTPKLQADAERLFRETAPRLPRLENIKGEFDVPQGENAVFANFQRLGSRAANDPTAKTRRVLIQTSTGPWEVDIAVDASSKGTKVVYRTPYRYELKPDCTSSYSEKNLAELKNKIIEIANR